MTNGTWKILLTGVTLAMAMVACVLAISLVMVLRQGQKPRPEIEEIMYRCLREDGIFRHPQLPFVVYAKNTQGRILRDAQIIYQDLGNQHHQYHLRAREAEVRVNGDQSKFLFRMKNCFFAGRAETGYFQDKVFALDIPHGVKLP